MFGCSAALAILGTRMQAEQSRVGKVRSSIAMWPPMLGSRSTRITCLPASARPQRRLDAGDAGADHQRRSGRPEAA